MKVKVIKFNCTIYIYIYIYFSIITRLVDTLRGVFIYN